MRPLIGITAGEIVNDLYPWSPVTHGQSFTYVDAIIHGGGTPVILPLTKDKTVLRELYDRCDGILFSGGNDIDPSLYGAEPIQKTINISPSRDKQELTLLDWALSEDKPILGICRGMQMLNVSRGGSLYQDLETELPSAGNHHISTDRKDIADIAHHLRIEKSSQLAAIVGADTLGTNAHHHQAVREVGEGVTATAWAEDGVVEAIEITDKPFVLAVQSHPESLEAKKEPVWRKLFTAFVDQAATYRKQSR